MIWKVHPYSFLYKEYYAENDVGMYGMNLAYHSLFNYYYSSYLCTFYMIFIPVVSLCVCMHNVNVCAHVYILYAIGQMQASRHMTYLQ